MNAAYVNNRQSETRNAGTMSYGYTGNWLLTRGSESRGKTPNGNTASISVDAAPITD